MHELVYVFKKKKPMKVLTGLVKLTEVITALKFCNCLTRRLVSWCFELSQSQRNVSGLKMCRYRYVQYSLAIINLSIANISNPKSC